LKAARRAATADPANQHARSALAYACFHRKDLGAFFAEAERAIALNPNSATTLAGLGRVLHFSGDARGIVFLRKAMALDPLHQTWLNLPIADFHFMRGEYEEALSAVRKIDAPDYFWTEIFLAGIHAALDNQSDAGRALEELLRLYPGFTTEKLIEEWRKWNAPDERIQRWVAALRKAGLPD
jgi:tetratricopeptide (TPR) repeat protein